MNRFYKCRRFYRYIFFFVINLSKTWKSSFVLQYSSFLNISQRTRRFPLVAILWNFEKNDKTIARLYKKYCFVEIVAKSYRKNYIETRSITTNWDDIENKNSKSIDEIFRDYYSKTRRKKKYSWELKLFISTWVSRRLFSVVTKVVKILS